METLFLTPNQMQFPIIIELAIKFRSCVLLYICVGGEILAHLLSST